MCSVSRWSLRSAVLVGALALTACSSPRDGTVDTADDPSGLSGTLTVFAASSLTDAFTTIGEAFHAAHPAVDVTFSFAGSGDLVAQLAEGAPADVLATADESNMAKAVEEGSVEGTPVAFAANTFGIIAGAGNPKGITGLADMANPDLLVVLCADTVPCGKGAATVLHNAGVAVTPVSYEDKVKGVVTKVTSGEADAGIVFVTDIAAAGQVASGVLIDSAVNAISTYPIVVTKGAPHAAAARAFVEFVTSAAGQEILSAFGFLAP